MSSGRAAWSSSKRRHLFVSGIHRNTQSTVFQEQSLVRVAGQPASRDLLSIVQTRALGTLPSFKALHSYQIPSWCLVLD